MTTREDLELAFLKAYSSGDREGAEILLREIRRLEGLDTPAGKAKDVAKSAAAGVSGVIYPLMAGALAAKAGVPPSRVTPTVRSLTGADYEPQTRLGGYAKNIAAGAVPGPGGVAGMVSGALGGALARAAEEAGFTDPLSQAIAWMGPSLAHGAVQAIRTGTPYKDIREVLAAMTPEERIATMRTLVEAQKRGVPMSVWQAAPEGSSLNVAGSAAARRPGAHMMQEVLRQQTPMAGQKWVRSQTEELFKGIVDKELTPDQVKTIAEAIKEVGKTRFLDPTSMKDVEKAAGLFAIRRPMTMDELVAELQRVSLSAPNSPEYKRLKDLVVAISAKKAEPPLVTEPRISRVGEAISAKGRIDAAMDEFASMDQATKGKIREAIDEVLKREVPGYEKALREYGKTKRIAEIMARDQALKGKHLVQSPEKEARLTMESAIPYALATNPWWASVPIIRSIASKDIMARIDAALASRNLKELEAIARQNPQIQGLLIPIVQAMRSSSSIPELRIEDVIRDFVQ